MTLENLAIVITPNLYKVPNVDPFEALMFSQKTTKFFQHLLAAYKAFIGSSVNLRKPRPKQDKPRRRSYSLDQIEYSENPSGNEKTEQTNRGLQAPSRPPKPAAPKPSLVPKPSTMRPRLNGKQLSASGSDSDGETSRAYAKTEPIIIPYNENVKTSSAPSSPNTNVQVPSKPNLRIRFLDQELKT